MDVRWVGQDDRAGCGLACLAMLTGRSYEAVRDAFARPFTERGGHLFEWDTYLTEAGYAVARLYWYRYGVQRADWPPAPFAPVHLCEVRVSEASPWAHMVVMLRDGVVLDPLTPRPRGLDEYAAVHNVAGVYYLGASRAEVPSAA